MALKIDNKIVHTTATERIMQNIEAFSTGTNGAISLSSNMIIGDIEETSQLSQIANLIGRRDITSDADATVKGVDSRDENNVKLYWGTGSVEFKAVDAKRYGTDSGAFSAAIGEQIGDGIVQYMLNNAITATRASIETVATLVIGDGTAAVTHKLLNSALKPFGDARDTIVAWVMTGATYADLVDAGLGIATSNVAGGAVAEGSVGSLGRPVYMTDSSGLSMATGTAILGLTREAVKVIESEAREFIAETVTGSENIKYRIQAEGSMMVNVKGFSWKTASGINPSVATLGTKTNWEQKATDIKSTAGVILNVS